MKQWWRKSAVELARLIASREVTVAEVIEAHLSRIDAVNPKLNAVVSVFADDARAAAAVADRQIANGEPLGPLHGVPFTIKANIDVAGQPTTWGVPALSRAVVRQDAPVVERLRAAGGIPIGRTNLPDMGLRMHTDSSLYGLTRNPWNADRTAGGSSGGEGAAIASGMSPLGLGNDLGGSLRNPATACGVTAIRPSAGRVPHAQVVPVEDRLFAVQAMMVQGPMARRVADLRLALRLMMGAHPRDPWVVSAPLEGVPPRRPVRVAVVEDPPGGATDTGVASTVRRAADVLSAAGYEVVTECPPRFEEALQMWQHLVAGDFGLALPRLMPLMGPDAARLVSALRDSASFSGPADMSLVLMQRDGLARAWSQFQASTPLVLTPTWAALPFENGFDVATVDGPRAVLEVIRPVLPANLLGLPSISVPAGRDDRTGLPIGVQLTGPMFREDLCLDAAEVIETSLGLLTPVDPAW